MKQSHKKFASLVDKVLEERGDEPISLSALGPLLNSRWPTWRDELDNLSLLKVARQVLMEEHEGFLLYKRANEYFVAMDALEEEEEAEEQEEAPTERLQRIVSEQVDKVDSVALDELGNYLRRYWPDYRADLQVQKLSHALERYLPQEDWVIHVRGVTPYLSRRRRPEQQPRRQQQNLSINAINNENIKAIKKAKSEIQWSVRLIENGRDATEVLQQIYERWEATKQRERIVAVDCEGYCLGARHGLTTLIQLAIPLTKQVFLFDVQTAEDIISVNGFSQPSNALHTSPSTLGGEELLRQLLEDSGVEKVMHGCTHDARALRADYGVRLRNVFDVQLAHRVLTGDPQSPSLNFLLSTYVQDQDLIHTSKDHFKQKHRNMSLWTRRPLTADMIDYAAQDVQLLVPQLHDSLRQKINALPIAKRQEFSALCKQYSLEDQEDGEATSNGRGQNGNSNGNENRNIVRGERNGDRNGNRNRNGSRQVATLTAENLQHHDKKYRELRQFGCEECNNRTWWKMVPIHKPVSRCKVCKVRYDAIPLEQAFGYGVYTCENCNHQWTNRNSKRNVQQNCRKCGAMVSPSSIGPPPKRFGARKSSFRHSCEECPSGACRFRFVPSQQHDSTGSTISTSISVVSVASFYGDAALRQIGDALRATERQY
ncbi:RNA helicase [Balamuthia mandrillaris]